MIVCSRPGSPALFVYFLNWLRLQSAALGIAQASLALHSLARLLTTCFLVLLIFMSRTALSYCSQSVKDRFLLAIFQHLNLVSCVSLSSVASRKRVQRYGLLWNWQAFTTFFFKKTAFFLHFLFYRTMVFPLRYFFVRFLRHQSKKWDSLKMSIFCIAHMCGRRKNR